MKEPSILDYLKSRLNPWQKEKIEIQDYVKEFRQSESPTVDESDSDAQPSPQSSVVEESVSTQAATPQSETTHVTAEAVTQSEKRPDLSEWDSQPIDDETREITIKLRMPMHVPWRTVLALFVGLFAQRLLEPPADSMPLALGLYLFALLLLAWAYFDREFIFAKPAMDSVSPSATKPVDPLTYHRNSLLIAAFLTMSAFIAFSDNTFTTLNVSIWLAALAMFLRSLWLPETTAPGQPSAFKKITNFFRQDAWGVSITRWAVLLVVVTAAILFFRFYRLDGIPGEPFSDHAEKLLDVYDITQGQTHIFFPRNTGREFIQFYWTALIASLLGTGLSFISLKIGTVLIGLFTLPYVYLIGQEVGGKRVALFALILAGTSYWLNTISRIGLRFPLYPALAAPALYYLIRGLRRQHRNDFILSGLFLGLGLHGYSPYRFVPFVVLLGVGLYLLHKQSQGSRKQTLVMLSILVLASFLVFLPLLRYALENPEMFSYRALTRLTGEEQSLSAPVWQIFMNNTFRAMTMFNYDDGEIWVHSVTHRPALDIVSAVLFALGYIILLLRYIRKRDWLDLFIFLSIPMLLMPSILSLAFPNENPSLNRTGGAAVMVFVVAALALDGFYTTLRSKKAGYKWAPVLVTILILLSSLQNYNLVFDQFSQQFMQGAWNTSDMGKVIRSFVTAGNSPDNAFVVPYPYWVDTRLVGIQAGYPIKDFAVWRDDLSKTQTLAGNKLFIVKEEDQDTLTVLKQMYPSGMLGHFVNQFEGKNFWIYTVPENITTVAP
ncbi:MAG: glycosyltransferase family 39 protein [Chloroflexota bacterium]